MRVVFELQGDAAELCMLGNHDEVRAFLKNVRR